MLQVTHQQIQLRIRQHRCREPGHLALGPASQGLRVANVALEEIPGEVFGGIERNVQVRAELCIASAIEPMTRQAILLEQRETFIDRVVLGQVGRW